MTREEKGVLASVGTGSVAGDTSAVAGVVTGATAGTTGAAALTSGLAAVGSVVGGGMLAGIFAVAAAPIAGAGVAYGCFKLYKHLANAK